MLSLSDGIAKTLLGCIISSRTSYTLKGSEQCTYATLQTVAIHQSPFDLERPSVIEGGALEMSVMEIWASYYFILFFSGCHFVRGGFNISEVTGGSFLRSVLEG